MVRTKKYSAFIDSLRKSLTNGQYEFIGKPVNKDALWGFGANWYSTTVEFEAEFDEMILTINADRLSVYVKEIYEKITYYGVLFKCLIENYENKYVCNDGRAALDITKSDVLEGLEPYRRTHAYMLVVEGTADKIRENAAKYLALDLTPIRLLTSDNYTIDGKFISTSNSEGSIVETNESKFKRGRGKSRAKEISHAKIRELFNEYIKLNGLTSDEAYTEIEKKLGVSKWTIGRALKSSE